MGYLEYFISHSFFFFLQSYHSVNEFRNFDQQFFAE